MSKSSVWGFVLCFWLDLCIQKNGFVLMLRFAGIALARRVVVSDL